MNFFEIWNRCFTENYSLALVLFAKLESDFSVSCWSDVMLWLARTQNRPTFRHVKFTSRYFIFTALFRRRFFGSFEVVEQVLASARGFVHLTL